MINGFTFAYELTTTHLEVVSYMAFFTNQKEFKDILQTIGFFLMTDNNTSHKVQLWLTIGLMSRSECFFKLRLPLFPGRFIPSEFWGRDLI